MCQKSFEKLKEIISNYPVLRTPNWQEPFFIHTNASNQGIGSVLQQVDPETNTLFPVCFSGRRLNKSEQAYNTYEKEVLALYYALNFFKQWIAGTETTIFTDNKALFSILTSNCYKSDKIDRFKLLLTCFGTDVKVKWISGKLNRVADHLSRLPF